MSRSCIITKELDIFAPAKKQRIPVGDIVFSFAQIGWLNKTVLPGKEG
jgi:hypothetical protein